MIAAIDVYYRGSTATVAGVLFERWDSDSAAEQLTVSFDNVAEYVPGRFYLRELPCILQLLEQVNARLEAVVIDGYVTLDASGRPGLGMHLWEALSGRVPVIGVAKNPFLATPDESKVFRGGSHRPLFVTSIGIPDEEARKGIAMMNGEHRIPSLLKRVDQLSRSPAAVARP